MFDRMTHLGTFAALVLSVTAVQAQTTWHVDDDNCPRPGSTVDPQL